MKRTIVVVMVLVVMLVSIGGCWVGWTVDGRGGRGGEYDRGGGHHGEQRHDGRR